MKLYNTASKSVETFEPLHDNHVTLYACGPTVYDYTHIGHLRKYSMDDVLVKTLRNSEYEVQHVQNITDVGHLSSDGDTGEDKLEKGAKKYGKSVWDVAHEFEEYFWQSMDQMGVARPDVSCRATDHIKQQLEMVIELEKKGHTYVIEGDGVYFDTSTFADYGKMAGLKLENQEEGARIGVVEGKRNPADFALWKFERPGENRAMVWESPWHPRSFPGWHIECSAMAMHYLGEKLDIHTGGIDHIPVHHTNEIAQAEAATGKQPFVKYWVHHNFLRVDGEKMSKSLENVFTIDDVVEKGYDPRALRLLFLMTHYRSEMNFTWESLAAVQKSWTRLMKLVQSLKATVPASEIEKTKIKDLAAYKTFYQHLQNDLATPEAVATMWSVTKDAALTDAQKLALLENFDQVLGIGITEAETVSAARESELPAAVQKLVDERAAARAAKDWQRSDILRDQLQQLGYQVKDSAEGQQVTKQ